MNIADKCWRVLLVDDHPLIRDGLRAALRRVLPQARFEEAGSATEAAQKLEPLRPHLILLDVNLPGISGLDLARQIHKTHPHVQLLMVAADADPWTLHEALAAGVSGFVSKRNTGACLADAIHTILRGEQYLCQDSQTALDRAKHHEFPTPEPPGPSVLTERECEVLRYLAHGENTKSIAHLLQVSPKTIETHRQHIMQKLRTNNVAALARYAIRHGLTTP